MNTPVKRSHRSNCPISSTLDILGDKWTLLILRDMLFFRKRTFGEFTTGAEGIATNILAERLKKLEEHGIISKNKAQDNKKTNIYSVTEKGIDLIPLLSEYILWGAKYLDLDLADNVKDYIEKLTENRDLAYAETLSKLENG